MLQSPCGMGLYQLKPQYVGTRSQKRLRARVQNKAQTSFKILFALTGLWARGKMVKNLFLPVFLNKKNRKKRVFDPFFNLK